MQTKKMWPRLKIAVSHPNFDFESILPEPGAPELFRMFALIWDANADWLSLNQRSAPTGQYELPAIDRSEMLDYDYYRWLAELFEKSPVSHR